MHARGVVCGRTKNSGQRTSRKAPLGLPMSVVVVELLVLLVVGSSVLLVVVGGTDVVLVVGAAVVVVGAAVVVVGAAVVVVGAAVVVVGAAVVVVGAAVVVVVGAAVLVVGTAVVVVVVLPQVNEPSADPCAAHASSGPTQSHVSPLLRSEQCVSPCASTRQQLTLSVPQLDRSAHDCTSL